MRHLVKSQTMHMANKHNKTSTIHHTITLHHTNESHQLYKISKKMHHGPFIEITYISKNIDFIENSLSRRCDLEKHRRETLSRKH